MRSSRISTEDLMAADAQIPPVAEAPDSARPPMLEESDRLDRPGVVPGDPVFRPAIGSESEEPDSGGRPLPEGIVEVAPPLSEQEPEPTEPPDRPITEVAPEEPGEQQPGGPIAEVRPPQPNPYEPSEQGPIPEVRPPDPGTPTP